MSADRWDEIGPLFERVRNHPPEKRASVLREHCDDPEVQQEVMSLLRAWDEDPRLFEFTAEELLASVGTVEREKGIKDQRTDDPLRLVGDQVGGYTVEEHLGGGGMGIVYRGWDSELDRWVALKFLPPTLADMPEADKRFVREAKAAASLDHSHIATIHEIGRMEEGRRFLAMTYYEGETLKSKIDRQERLPVEEAVGYAEQIAEALTRSHDAGIIHRDVKPANVMVTDRGTVKLLDFGLAQVRDRSGLTETGQRLGTVAYMSPEQVEGKDVGPFTDLWALGVVLYEMLTGSRPFQGRRKTAVLHSILHDAPVPVGESRSAISDDLESVVDRCLEKNASDRYSKAEVLLADLHALRSDTASLSPETRASHENGSVFGARNWYVGAALLSLLILGVVASWVFWPRQAGSSSTSAQERVVERSIAVLPFETIGESASSEGFSRGIHTDLLTRLANVSGTRVISKTSVRQYRGTEKTAAEIAEELDVRWVLEGEVQRRGERIQIHAQLIDPQTNSSIWAEQYQRELTAQNLFALQGALTKRIARSMQATLTPDERRRLERRPTRSLAAYRLYVQGRTHFDQRTESGMQQAVGYFRRAIEKDSTYAQAWSGLADAISLSRHYGYDIPQLDEMTPEAAARTAVKLAPNLAAAHASLGRIYLRRREGLAALRKFRRATQLNSSYAQAFHWLGTTEVNLGRLDSALVHMEQAVELDPQAPIIRIGLAGCYYFAGRYNDALRQFRRAEKLAPHLGIAHLSAGRTLSTLGRHEAATAKVQRGLNQLPKQSAYRTLFAGWPGIVHAQAGDTSRAMDELADIDSGPASALEQAFIHAALGNADVAASVLQEARPVQWSWVNVGLFRYGPLLSPLRGDSTYRKVRQRLDRSIGVELEGRLPADHPM